MEEEILSLMSLGFKLVKDLEQTLVTINSTRSNRLEPHVLAKFCDDIIRVFGNMRELLRAPGAAALMVHHHEPPALEAPEMMGSVHDHQEWLSRVSQAMEMAMIDRVTQGGGGGGSYHHRAWPENISTSGLMDSQAPETADIIASGPQENLRGGNVEAPPVEVAADHSSRAAGPSAVLQRSRRRNEGDRRTIRVPAPRMGNTDVSPEDGYTWRKYGQKEILGWRFPRSYYRCTHQKLYDCPAKKQVQRLDNDPFTLEVTYRGDHTCTMSSTAPSVAPLPITAQSPPQNLGALADNWLSMDITSSGEGTSTSNIYNIDMHMFSDPSGLGGQGTGNSDGAGPSTTRYIDYLGFTDFADVIFNSGSSSNNSMDLIFPAIENKWTGGDGKN